MDVAVATRTEPDAWTFLALDKGETLDLSQRLVMDPGDTLSEASSDI